MYSDSVVAFRAKIDLFKCMNSAGKIRDVVGTTYSTYPQKLYNTSQHT